MNKTLIVASAAIILSSAVVVSISRETYQDLYGRFPELDRKIVRKAYRQFLKNSLAGKYNENLNDLTDTEMDFLFLDIYRSYTK